MNRSALIIVMLSSLVVVGCAGEGDLSPRLETRRAALYGASDSMSGLQGPQLSGLSTTTQVWAVTRDWADVSSEAGLAWSANSGMTWEEKYRAWIGGFNPTPSVDGHTTFTMTNWQLYIRHSIYNMYPPYGNKKKT